MVGKRAGNERYDIHGSDVESLRQGFTELGVPEHRRATALELVREVLEANGARDFYWYKPPATAELCGYWDDADQNLVWVTTAAVAVINGPIIALPPRPLTYKKAEGDYVGWVLPGADPGTGGGRRSPEVPTVRCPQTFLRQPVGSLCPECDVVHP